MCSTHVDIGVMHDLQVDWWGHASSALPTALPSLQEQQSVVSSWRGAACHKKEGVCNYSTATLIC